MKGNLDKHKNIVFPLLLLGYLSFTSLNGVQNYHQEVLISWYSIYKNKLYIIILFYNVREKICITLIIYKKKDYVYKIGIRKCIKIK